MSCIPHECVCMSCYQPMQQRDSGQGIIEDVILIQQWAWEVCLTAFWSQVAITALLYWISGWCGLQTPVWARST